MRVAGSGNLTHHPRRLLKPLLVIAGAMTWRGVLSQAIVSFLSDVIGGRLWRHRGPVSLLVALLAFIEASGIALASPPPNCASQEAAHFLGESGLRATLSEFGYQMADEADRVPRAERVHLDRLTPCSLRAERVTVGVTRRRITGGRMQRVQCEVEFCWSPTAVAARNWQSPAFIGIVCRSLGTGRTVRQSSSPVLIVPQGQPARVHITLGRELQDPGLYSFSVVILGRDAAEKPLYLLGAYRGLLVAQE